MAKKIQDFALLWFRQDLRLSDNAALRTAAQSNLPIVPLYILDDDSAGNWKMGGASRWWLHHSLQALSSALDGALHIQKGDAKTIIETLVDTYPIRVVYWNRCYEPWRIKRDSQIKDMLTAKGIEGKSYNGALLYEPWTVKKDDGDPYRVFTPFYKKGCLGVHGEPPEPQNKPSYMDLLRLNDLNTDISDLNLLPNIKWYKTMEDVWEPGEDGAIKRARTFIDHHLQDYKAERDYPDKESVSRLSPHLHFGEISPNRLWSLARGHEAREGHSAAVEKFLAELGWREFSYYLLYHFPTITDENFQAKFDHFPWDKNDKALTRWQKGQTGYPIVDAGMRQLWTEGWMHNRVRMVVGSFLVKHLLIHWREGEAWFWDCLVDADLASNSASWQWIAGSGADAAPYFRIFNPMTQGEKFDKEGAYVRKYVPELKDLPVKYIHKPWEAPEEVLKEACITLGETYPTPIVDHFEARERALKAFEETKGSK